MARGNHIFGGFTIRQNWIKQIVPLNFTQMSKMPHIRHAVPLLWTATRNKWEEMAASQILGDLQRSTVFPVTYKGHHTDSALHATSSVPARTCYVNRQGHGRVLEMKRGLSYLFFTGPFMFWSLHSVTVKTTGGFLKNQNKTREVLSVAEEDCGMPSLGTPGKRKQQHWNALVVDGVLLKDRLRSLEHWALLQRTRVRFPAPTQPLPDPCNGSLTSSTSSTGSAHT